MAETEQNNSTKIQRGTSLDPEIDAIIDRWAKKDERSISQTIERLLKTHPQVEQALKAEQQGATA